MSACPHNKALHITAGDITYSNDELLVRNITMDQR